MLFDRTSDVALLISSDDPELLDQAVQYAKEIHEEEVRSGASVETKATTLIAALGIIATLLAGAGGLFLDQVRQATSCWLVTIILAGAFGAAGVFLLLALVHAIAALKVTVLARPNPEMYVNLGSTSLVELRRRQLAALLVSQNKNRVANDEKAQNLTAGYKHLQHTAIGLLVAAGTLIVYGLWLQFR